MKNNLLTKITAGILVLIFLFLLLSFQVRRTEVAVVTTFGKHSRTITEPGLYFSLPWPIQKIYPFENRIRSMDRKFETIQTADNKIIMGTVFIGWRIDDPKLFLQRFENNIEKAESSLENLVRDAKNSVIGRHPFSDLISPNPADLKFEDVEREMLEHVQSLALSEYGIEIRLLGIKQLGLPENVTTAVFQRMVAEREVLIQQLQGEGDRRAEEIRSEANRTRDGILAQAQAEARLIEGKADALAANFYKVFESNPELAILILRLNALEEMLKGRTTLILDQGSGPLNLLQNGVLPENLDVTVPSPLSTSKQ